MSMPEETRVLPHFIELGSQKTSELVAILEKHGVVQDRVLLLCDDNTVKIGGQAIIKTLRKKKLLVFEHRVDNSDEITVLSVEHTITHNACDLVIGFGGGKVLDVAKLAAAKNRAAFISVPTTLSNDGIASPVSVIKDARNIPISHITQPPFGVIIDIDIIRRAPRRHLMAGVGDLISNLSAVFDARLAHEKSQEQIDNSALLLSEAGGKRIMELQDNDIGSSLFLKELAHGLIKSGFAMCMSGTSRPASGSEHKISHSIDHYYPPCKGLHGEQVGIASLFTMALQNNEFLETVRKFYAKIGFPNKIVYLNLNQDEFTRVVLNATRIRPERYTILEDKRPTAQMVREIIEHLSL